ncbi:hypothetical protein GCM10025880_64350 [Methylorubrum aminovorans]|nr:hypothetical protein GCM10025880_64350 [Methylorubrum aminovorans]
MQDEAALRSLSDLRQDCADLPDQRTHLVRAEPVVGEIRCHDANRHADVRAVVVTLRPFQPTGPPPKEFGGHLKRGRCDSQHETRSEIDGIVCLSWVFMWRPVERVVSRE